MKNHWGEPDEEPLPDWMNPETYRYPNKRKARILQTLEEACAEALKKPPIPILLKPPKNDDL
jgi:hypothetical protein